ncbi:exodeoxyribonuclease V subunit beta [Azohydromonas caseinilytica]|uniref:RecBCD enzyme subunit RecB n=1 Tax=Azohydromonas caseinilytica TaxID=2728836 RepID=A0A848FHJ1_9BURK|nr:exodeoxyribonuclease V subunit beta [Azohydromonas caseinilytica]NML18315.1 exodeoxyribonuclease V subunit beta [Azohydromonas caseinilytica]
MTELLDPLRLPLWGSRLIEASAGTGKTYTIAALYLRLVLGHGPEDGAFHRPLLPAEILVMTFTRAATRELSDRIRARLIEAAQVFRGEAEPQEGDRLLRELLAGYPDGPERTRAAWRLACAAEAMDDAAVHTIDAWCQRMLREHAFDSRNLFDEELLADERRLQEEAVRDYWRQHVYPLDDSALDAVFELWPDVGALYQDVAALVSRIGPGAAVPPALSELCTRVLAEQAQHLARLKDGWAERVQALRDWFTAEQARKVCLLDRKKLQPRFYEPWLDKLEAWATTPGQLDPELPDAGRHRLSVEGMREAVKPELVLPSHFEAIEQLLEALAALPDLKAQLRQHAAQCIARRLAELKTQAGAYGFADMLVRLDQALHDEAAGQRLRERILAQYPVALVDEFQDTSPLQYRLFDRLYRTADCCRDSALLLIGDPKQSIYAFRGADIHSYLGARRATAGRHYVLGTNHRSTQALVRAVNQLFRQAEERAEGAGAFLFRSEFDDPLPFQVVEARGRPERFVCNEGEVPALSLCVDVELGNAESHRRRAAERCAEGIVTLLNDPAAGFEHPEDGFTRLRPADIAVLVRTGVEADCVRRELRRRDIASVYLSDKDSVFASAEARDLLRWLRAVAAPLDMRLARAAYATALVGLSLPELARLAADDEAWEQRLEQLRELRSVWERQGVLTMLRQTLHRLELPARWLSAPDGERRLTNVLHIAELLQAASAQLDGEQALVRWLTEQIENEDATEGDERIVRLESDADLVKVVTIHKSKGLEYPLVFLPFICDFRPVEKKGRSFIELAGEDGSRQLQFNLSAELLEQADRDRLREDLRLLYVALTRARHALWLGVAALKKGQAKQCVMHRCALGQLIGGGEAISESEILARLKAACGEDEAIALLEPPVNCATTPLLPRDDAPALQPGAEYVARFERDWSIGSFSKLVKRLPTLPAERLEEAPVRESDEFAPGPLPLAPANGEPWHRFPRGAFAGNFLHDQLEWLAGEDFALRDNEPLREQLLRRCERQGWGNRAEEVLAWLSAAVDVELPPLGVPLSALAHTLPEMEFWLPSEGLDAARIDALCGEYLLPGRERPSLPQRQLRGMLMGFADLVFEHEGRYWVLDYKSNALGPRDPDYGPDAMEAAMAAHRYDVQAALYLLALHRQLRSRLGEDYDPAEQLGGALYFFIRGIRHPRRGCLWVAPDMALLEALDEALAGEEDPR